MELYLAISSRFWIPVKVRIKFLLMVAKDQCPARRVKGALTRSRSAQILRKICPASMPSISRMSGQEWLRMMEYLVLHRASGTRGLTSRVELEGDGFAGGFDEAGAKAAALAKDVVVEGGLAARGPSEAGGA
jgi:hypothetical protein